jgi:VCBS repeat-containing protein
MGAKLLLLPLEQRQLFDGAGIAAGLAASDFVDSAEDANTDAAERSDLAGARIQSGRLTESIAQRGEPLKELLIIDPTVQDWQSLTAGLDSRAEIFVLDGTKDGIEQVADKLASSPNRYTALHILSHGGDGSIRLGASTVDAQTIANSSSEFAQIGDGIIEGGDVLIYGCDVGSTLKGASFLEALARATQRDVAGSTDLTGGQIAGGDWRLEAKIGNIDTSYVSESLLEDVGYQYLLADNDAPVAVDDNRSIFDNEVVANGQAIRGSVFGDNADSDPNGDSFTVAGIQTGVVAGPVLTGVDSVIQGVWGTVRIDTNGAYTYTPNAAARALNTGESAVEVFTYTICDSNNLVDSAVITIAIYGVTDTPVNLPPIPVADVRTVCESEVINDGQAIRGNLLGDRADSDPEGQSFVVAGATIGDVASGPAVLTGVNTPIVGQYGTLTIRDDGSYTYTPNANAVALTQGQSRVDVFTYTICDVNNATANSTISITVCGEGVPANNPPVANNDRREICEDDSLIDGQALRGNSLGDVRDIDPDGDSLKVNGVKAGDVVAVGAAGIAGNVGSSVAGQWGTIVIADDGSYKYTPSTAAQSLAEGQLVQDVFTYSICDAAGATSIAKITISICGQNDAPVARNDVREVCEDDLAIRGDAIGGNNLGDVKDSDPDNNGAADVLKVNGIRVGDNNSSLNVPPVGGVGSSIAGQWGSIVIAADGSYTYTPSPAAQALSANETVQDIFTYSICDASGATSTATITINICGENDAPIARNDERTTSPTIPITNGGSITGNTLGDVKDGDPDRNDTLTVIGVRPGAEDPNCLPSATGDAKPSASEAANVSQPIAGTYGTIVLKPDGSYVYTPNAAAATLTEGQKVQDVFAYTVSDGKGGTDCAQITIRMEGTAKPIVITPVVPPTVVPPTVVPPTVIPPTVIAPVIVPPVLIQPTIGAEPRAVPVATTPVIAPVLLTRAPLNLGSAIVFEQAGNLEASPFGDTPRVVKGFVDDTTVAKEDCVPTPVKAKPKSFVMVKPKIKPSVFADVVEKPNKAFSEQVKIAAKKLKMPAKVAPKVVEKEC